MNLKNFVVAGVACFAVCNMFVACKKQCKSGQVLDGKKCVDTTNVIPVNPPTHYNILLPFSKNIAESATAAQIADSAANPLIDTIYLVSNNDFGDMKAVDMSGVANRAVALKNAAGGYSVVLGKGSIQSQAINPQDSIALASMGWTVSSTGVPIDPNPDSNRIDSSGTCVVRLQNTTASDYYIVFIDGKIVTMNDRQLIGGTESADGGLWIKYDVQAGTRTFYAEQQTGIVPGETIKTKTEGKLLPTDTVFTWFFP